MPAYDDSDTPRLGEIARTLTDFRNEYRAGINGMVRKDVYTADNVARDQRITAIEARNVALEAQLQTGDANAKTRANLLYGVALTAGASLLGWILTAISGG